MEKEEEIEFWMPHPIYHIEASNFGRFIIRTNQFGATKITLGTEIEELVIEQRMSIL